MSEGGLIVRLARHVEDLADEHCASLEWDPRHSYARAYDESRRVVVPPIRSRITYRERWARLMPPMPGSS